MSPRGEHIVVVVVKGGDEVQSQAGVVIQRSKGIEKRCESESESESESKREN